MRSGIHASIDFFMLLRVVIVVAEEMHMVCLRGTDGLLDVMSAIPGLTCDVELPRSGVYMYGSSDMTWGLKEINLMSHKYDKKYGY
jgi:hypothetical protein